MRCPCGWWREVKKAGSGSLTLEDGMQCLLAVGPAACSESFKLRCISGSSVDSVALSLPVPVGARGRAAGLEGMNCPEGGWCSCHLLAGPQRHQECLDNQPSPIPGLGFLLSLPKWSDRCIDFCAVHVQIGHQCTTTHHRAILKAGGHRSCSMRRPCSIRTLSSADSMAQFDPFQKMARDTSASAVLVGCSLSHEASRL